MKARLSLFLVGLFFLSQTVWATTTTFTVSATIHNTPAVVSLAVSSITVSSVNTLTNVFVGQPAGTTDLNFDPMVFDATNGIYVPNHYFAIDFGVIGESGSQDVTVSYTEGNNPNGSTNGLGYKTSATFAREVANSDGSTTETLLIAHGPKKRLIDVGLENILNAEIAGGWLRVYLGVCSGGAGGGPQPFTNFDGCQPFSNADGAGRYTGLLLVTSVVN